MTDFTRAEIEAGRRLFASEWHFVAAAGSPASLPPMRGVEIAFAGRSNVGKSSLINALTGRKNLARISRTPGRTQELVFFTGGDTLNIVDMPGYGYAAAAKSKIEAWTALIDAFLRGRSNLARVYVLVDARHGLKSTDEPALDALGQAAVSHQVVLTKCDELRPSELGSRIAELETMLSKRPAAFPKVLATSSHEGAGISELRAAIARLLGERGRRRIVVRRLHRLEPPAMSKTPKIDPPTQARILVEALPHMQRYDEEIVVVKYGGHAMGQEQMARDFARDIVLLEQTAINPVVVHGGGPQIEAMLKKLGIKSEFTAGLRVTDEKTVEIVEMVLAGSINKQIVGYINAAGGKPIGLVCQ